MRARRVDGLHPERSLAENACRVIAVRLDELYSFVPAALDPSEVGRLHDMRIAAKRLRYVLEFSAFCFGVYAERASATARELQGLIGEVHDLDVLLDRIERSGVAGLGELADRKRAERQLCFERFVRCWRQIEQDGFREKLLDAVGATLSG